MLRNICLLLTIFLSGCETLSALPDAAPPVPREQPQSAHAPLEAPIEPPVKPQTVTQQAAKTGEVEREEKTTGSAAAHQRNAQTKFINGSAAYQIPPVMTEDSPSPVDLWIDAGVSVEKITSELKEYLTENLKRTAQRFERPLDTVKAKSIGTDVVGQSVLIGKRMYAELSGEGFSFDKTGPQERTFIAGQPLKWSWIVTPKKAGNDLILKIEVRTDLGEGEASIEPIRDYVRVNARPLTWKEKFERIEWWVKALTGMGISTLIAAIYKLMMKKQQKDDDV